MAVNTAALKTFAPAMRRQLLEAVGRKLDLLLNSQTPDTLSTYAKQIAELREEEEKSREQLLERVAYTWFNRLCALRYLDAKGWHPFGCKVLMPADGSETQPELLKLMRSGSLPADLKTFTNEQRLNQLLDGQIPTAIPGGDAQGEVYRELVLAACRSYHNLLPDLFEGLDDASELLLPDDLLTEGSIAGNFRSAISDSDCDDVEIIGWLYQFYISEKKDEVIGKVVKTEDIPAATQLFTPNWIVKYMVQNTIGAQWLATYPDSPLREQMEFYIEPAEQTDDVKAKLAEITPASLNPEELTLMDPACGSGHILVEAYEIFKAIYLEQGYQLREVPKLILEKNLFGLDIDQRAAQLTCFALTMKGRDDDRRLFNRGIKINVMALQDSTDFDIQQIAQLINLDLYELHINDFIELKRLFENATKFGSLSRVPEDLNTKARAIKKSIKSLTNGLIASEIVKVLRPIVQQAELLSGKYDAVVANPPYMGSKSMPMEVKRFTEKEFAKSKRDLYACFIEKSIGMTKKAGKTGLVTIQNWLFQSSFKELRDYLTSSCTLSNLIQIGYNSFPSLNSKVALAAAFVFKPTHIKGSVSTFIDLNSSPQSANKEDIFLTKREELTFLESCDIFSRIPGNVFAYTSAAHLANAFNQFPPLSKVAITRQGIATGNDEKYVRLWHEIGVGSLNMNATCKDDAWKSGMKWFPLNKGGPFRKWFGNSLHVIAFDKRSYDELRLIGNHCPSEDLYFKPAASWSDIATKAFGARYRDSGEVFATLSMSVFAQKLSIEFITAFLNSPVNKYILDLISPGLHYSVGYVANIPIISEISAVSKLSAECIEITRKDWNQQEFSNSFQSNPLTTISNSRQGATLHSAVNEFSDQCDLITQKVLSLEHQINKYLISSFSLEAILEAMPTIENITLFSNPFYKYSSNNASNDLQLRHILDTIKDFLSYGCGCMMGRYSLDHPGLILADSRSNQDEQLAAYEAKIGKPISEIQFKPDADAIIPVLDGEWFEDDIVARTREFLKVTFPESSVAENLRFIEDSIGKDIRKYFCKDFYKDHLQTYKKRPIYWMVQSPKAGFACLIYLHRYTPDTLLQVLNNYFRPYLQKLEARHEQLERDQNNDALPKREQTAARKEAEKITKVLKECQAWEQDALLPLAQQRIELDLDDGVKVNYLKLQEVLAKIPGLAAKGS